MIATTTCSKCGNRIWWEESTGRTCWVSNQSGSWCVGETSHTPIDTDDDVSREDVIREVLGRLETIVVPDILEEYFYGIRGGVEAAIQTVQEMLDEQVDF